MNRTLLNIIIDLLATLSFLGMIATGYLLHFPMPPGSNRTHFLWGLTRHQWGDIHFWISIALLLIMLVHLALHWNWIVTVIGKRCGLVKGSHPSLIRCGLWTILGLIALCGGFIWLIEANLEIVDHPGRGHRNQGYKNHSSEVQAFPKSSDSPENAVLVWSDVYPVFQKHCLACHGPGQQWADFRVDQAKYFFNPDKPLIIPGQAEQSPLIAIVSGRRADMAMVDAHRLEDKDVNRIKSWIEQGAN